MTVRWKFSSQEHTKDENTKSVVVLRRHVRPPDKSCVVLSHVEQKKKAKIWFVFFFSTLQIFKTWIKWHRKADYLGKRILLLRDVSIIRMSEDQEDNWLKNVFCFFFIIAHFASMETFFCFFLFCFFREVSQRGSCFRSRNPRKVSSISPPKRSFIPPEYTAALQNTFHFSPSTVLGPQSPLSAASF